MVIKISNNIGFGIYLNIYSMKIPGNLKSDLKT